jgi:DNA-binding CsgD family transcriptional regulator
MPSAPELNSRLISGKDQPSRDTPLHSGPLMSTLECIGCGGIMRDRFGGVLHINCVALQLLKREIGTMELDNRHRIAAAVQQLLSRASPRASADGASWVTVRRQSGRPLAIYQLEIGDPPGTTILILVDIETSLQPRPRTLQRMFGLTTAEMRLASGLASGCAPTDLARQQHVSRATVRSQLASIFAKTQTRRQAELVALLAKIALLP